MPTLSSGLTLIIPASGDSNWSSSINTYCFQKISEHDHTGSGKGLQIGTAAIADGSITTAKLASTLGTVPAGAILAWGGPSAPTGYLLCDGSAVSRTTYATLFFSISTAYGVGNGTTTFNVPNLQQRFPLGKATSGTGSALGDTGGTIDHTHANPAHTHENFNSHSHTLTAAYAKIDLTGSVSTQTTATVASYGYTREIDPNAVYAISGNTTGATALGGSTDSSGAGSVGPDGGTTSDAKNPPYQVVNYIIKT